MDTFNMLLFVISNTFKIEMDKKTKQKTYFRQQVQVQNFLDKPQRSNLQFYR